MYTVFFFNFGFTKHFDLESEAIEYANKSGFECAVIGPDNELVKKVSVL